MIFLRHAVTSAGPDLCYGRTDVGLGAEAPAQMAAAVASLARPAAIRSSPLSRARLLAEMIGEAHGLAVDLDPRLQEYDFGTWEGRNWPEIPRAETDPWIADMLNAAPPGGESFAALVARVRAAIADAPEGTLFVCHAGPIRAARMILTGANFDQVFAEKVPFCEPIVLQAERV